MGSAVVDPDMKRHIPEAFEFSANKHKQGDRKTHTPDPEPSFE